jgi:hypothetical protein
MLTGIRRLLEVSGNRICLPGGVPSADAGTEGAEAKSILLFTARPVKTFVIVLHY